MNKKAMEKQGKKQNKMHSYESLRDKRWPILKDIILFEELLKARRQLDDYWGLSWDDKEMWEQLSREVNNKVLSLTNVRKTGYKAVKSRVNKYVDARLESKGDCFRDDHLRRLAKEVFELGPPEFPDDSDGEPSDAASASHGGGLTRWERLMLKMRKLKNDLTSWEYNWAIDHFGENKLKYSIFFSLNLQERIGYVKANAPSISPDVS